LDFERGVDYAAPAARNDFSPCSEARLVMASMRAAGFAARQYQLHQL